MIGICSACLALAALAHGAAASTGISEPPVADERVALAETVEVVGSVDDDAVERARGVTLENETLRLLPAQTLAEALGELPGVVVLFAGPFGGVPMVLARGFFGGGEVDYVGLEMDGAPRAELESGVADWGAVRLRDVERLDYLPGPSLRRGGVDPALAGLVRLTPRSPRSLSSPSSTAAQAEQLDAALSTGSYATRAAELSWNRRGRLHTTISADATETDGYRDHSASEGYGVELRLDRPAPNGAFVLSAFARRREREEPGPLSERELESDALASNALFADDRERADRWGLAGRYERQLGRVPLEARFGIEGRESRFLRTLLLAEGYGDRALRELDTGAWSVGLSTPGEIELGDRTAVRFAFDHRSEESDTRYLAPESGALRAAERARRARFALEVGGGLRLHPRLEIDASVRADRIDDRAASSGATRHEAYSPRLGAVWSVPTGEGPELELVAEIGRAFKAPTLDQLYDPRPFADPGGGGDFTLSNPTLAPQESRGVELGARWRRGSATLRLAAYRLWLENEIDFDPATFRYGNIGRSRHDGIEVWGELDGGVWGKLRGSYARAEARAEGETPSGQLKILPRDIARLGWTLLLPAGLELDLRFSLLANRFADDRNLHPLADMRRADLRIARRFGALHVAVDALNLLDDDALELAYLLPGATGGEVLHGFAAAPRAFRIVLEHSWGAAAD